MNEETEKFNKDLEKAVQARQEFAGYLTNIVNILNQSEAEGEKASGALDLENDIKELEVEIDKLKNGVFRVLVIGEFNRGKSTLLNRLFGEKFLPVDGKACTAILTFIQYGENKQVTIYFNDGKPAKSLSFEDFNNEYTLKKQKGVRSSQKEEKSTFSDISHAIVNYPNPLLANGIEFIDSPGLNDESEHDTLTLSQVRESHALLFVLDANQQLTLNEKEHLRDFLEKLVQNHLK